MLTLRHHVDARDKPGHDDQLKALLSIIAYGCGRSAIKPDL